MTARCRIEVVADGSADDFALATVQRVVDAALAEDGMERCLLAVRLVGDAESARLHAEHFDDPEPTDVMAFPDGTIDPETERHRLGDLAVCVDVAARAAGERGRPVADELTLYVLHGVLHLLGYDDQDDADRAAMWAVQRRLLATIGIAIEPHAQ